MTVLKSPPIIVHSHLSWDWVWQRPQQFASRLSRQRQVLFVDALRVEDIAEPRLELAGVPAYPQVTLLQMTFPRSRWNARNAAWVDCQRLQLLCEALNGPLRGRFDKPVQWFYDPMAVTAFAGHLDESALVYDCMDELSGFRFPPPDLMKREMELLQRADLVFTGGRKLWESKRRFNTNCHFYGCGVDVEHFGKARHTITTPPPDLPPSPILGYFGVVDERLDYDLLAKLADANTDWQVVLIGPTTKINAADLPQRPNLHFLGGCDYEQLPHYARRFDVCLMPFARNSATEYINPTKALEYMATARPIVSTDIPDVVSNYATVAKIATSHEEFIAVCRAALEAPDTDAIARGVRLAYANTWDAVVAQLEGHLEATLRRNSPSSSAIELTKLTSSSAVCSLEEQ